MPHQARHIGSLADSGIPNHVKVGEAREPQRLPNSVSAGFLHIKIKFCGATDSQPSQQSQHSGRGVLRLGRKAVRSLVGRSKSGMPLRNNIGLAGKPDAIRSKMRE